MFKILDIKSENDGTYTLSGVEEGKIVHYTKCILTSDFPDGNNSQIRYFTITFATANGSKDGFTTD